MLLAAMILLQHLIDRGHLILIQVAYCSSMTIAILVEREQLQIAFLMQYCCSRLPPLYVMLPLTSMLLIHVWVLCLCPITFSVRPQRRQ